MTVDALSVFGAVEKADASFSSAYIDPGTHILEIEALKLIQKWDGSNIFVAELTTLWSADDVHKKGSKLAYLENLSKPATGSPGRVKSFAMAFGPDLTEDDISKEDLVKMVSDEQPAAGFRLLCHAHHKPKKSNPDEVVTVYRWSYVDPETPIEDVLKAAKVAQA